jgi:hypothetical protein
MAIYAVFLLSIICSGTTCAFGTMFMLTLTGDPKASGLMAGHEAGIWRLDQMREHGLLGADQTPTLYFDGTRMRDGSSGCAFTEGTLTGWKLWHETGSVPVSGATVTGLGRSVTVAQGQDKVTCILLDLATADHFARMMTAESAR